MGIKSRRDITGDEWATLPNALFAWINEALKPDAPRPSFQDCCILSDRIRVALNRAHNSVIKRRADGPVEWSKFKDMTVDDAQALTIEPFLAVAKETLENLLLLESARVHIEENWGDYHWPGGVSLSEIEGAALALRQLLMSAGAYMDEPKAKRVAWHDAAKPIAVAIRELLKKAGYKGSSSLRKADSATLAIASKVMQWAFKVEVSPNAYALALKDRDDRRRSPPLGVRTDSGFGPATKRIAGNKLALSTHTVTRQPNDDNSNRSDP